MRAGRQVLLQFLDALASVEHDLPGDLPARVRSGEDRGYGYLPSGLRYSVRGSTWRFTLPRGPELELEIGADGVPTWNVGSIGTFLWSQRETLEDRWVEAAIADALERREVFEIRPGRYATRRG